MGEKIIVGPVNKGLRTDRTPFVIDNDSFPSLINAYQWRGRVKRKRGTQTLGRLTRFFNSTISSYSATATINLSGGAANLLTGFSLQTNGNIVPGSVTVIDTSAGVTYTDPGASGVLVGAPSGSGTINYGTGAITISAGAAHAISASFFYYPDLPVMGVRDFILDSTSFPNTVSFDTKYSYAVQSFSPFGIYDVSFYKNPPNGSYVGYTEKTNITPTTWNGQNYQQFYTVNYAGALWATNGINSPLPLTKIGMQYKPIISVTVTAGGPPATASLQITGHGLVEGDFVFINEVQTTTGINFQTGYVITVTDANNVIVEFPNATIATNGTGGIAQYLTNRSDVTKDCLRWYDGDPTNGSATAPALTGHLGWVNFAPPISQASFSVQDLPQAQYYLVGAKLIIPFKDRLLFFAPVVQTSAANSQVFLPDTIIFSQNGTPFYTSSFTGPVNSAATVFHPILVPANETATANAFFEDSVGFGGNYTFGISQTINTVSTNEDALVVGFDRLQTRVVYTGNDVVPFNAFVINAEYGSGSTFSTINMDKGVLTVGKRGLVITSQTESRRFDLDILDQVFEISLINNGAERVTAARDFESEWIYFTYVSGQSNSTIYEFPNQTLQYNYRDDSWAIFNEAYTTYGFFRQQTGDTWANIGQKFPTWNQWNVPWEDGDSSNLLQQQVLAGNQQGFLILRNVGTSEGNSLYVRGISSGIITSPDHGLFSGDYIIISGALGVNGINNRIFQVGDIVTEDTFILSPVPSDSGAGYIGGGVIQRLYVPFIQTKQFPPSWGISRKTRIGVQQYLLTSTANGQVQLLIFLSENPIGVATAAYNTGPLVPGFNVINGTLVYSTLLYTTPESTNLGLTAANTNLNLITASHQNQIWHRMNTSLVGDTVQIAITLSDEQMKSLTDSGAFFNITGATNANPCVLTVSNTVGINQLIQITGVGGMTQLNGNVYSVVDSSASTITIDVDSTAFGAYTSGGRAVVVAPLVQFSEIELHAFIMDVTPSQVLA